MSGTARLTPFRVHVADQILAALTEASPLPLSTMAIEDRTGYGRGLVYQMLTRLASAGDVEQGHPSGHQALFLAGTPG